jgi:hypothetical protein
MTLRLRPSFAVKSSPPRYIKKRPATFVAIYMVRNVKRGSRGEIYQKSRARRLARGILIKGSFHQVKGERIQPTRLRIPPRQILRRPLGSLRRRIEIGEGDMGG